MSSFCYNKYRVAAESWSNAGLSAAIDLLTDTIKAIPVLSSYAPAASSTDQFLSALGSNITGMTGVALASKTMSATGVFSCAALSFSGLPSSGTVGSLVYYKDTGSPTTSPLLCYYDGKVIVTAAASAVTTATSIVIEPLPFGLASGTTIAFSGGTTATLSSAYTANTWTLAVNALAGAVAQGETGPAIVANANLPIALNPGQTINQTIDATNGVFRL